MDANLKKANQLRAESTIRSLEANGFEATYLESSEELLPCLEKLINDGSSVGVGGSMTLKDTGVLDWLRNNKGITFFDRYNTDDVDKVFHDSLNADFYLMSTNAITVDGHLYNVDGNGNRVAALTFGPKNVIVITGVNKIVKNLDEAIIRNEQVAAVANNLRLGLDNPCTKIGECAHCNLESSICNHFVVTRRCRPAKRIHVIIINEELGY